MIMIQVSMLFVVTEAVAVAVAAQRHRLSLMSVTEPTKIRDDETGDRGSEHGSQRCSGRDD